MDINDIYFFQTEYDHRVSMVGKILKENFMERYQKLNNCIQI